ncbi:MAG: hypothetical protein J6T16_02515, partial [Opitutales bacterium]|nr:hypothetical protein [Opitutales bacterium]
MYTPFAFPFFVLAMLCSNAFVLRPLPEMELKIKNEKLWRVAPKSLTGVALWLICEKKKFLNLFCSSLKNPKTFYPLCEQSIALARTWRLARLIARICLVGLRQVRAPRPAGKLLRNF